jgi:hypothetical protein
MHWDAIILYTLTGWSVAEMALAIHQTSNAVRAIPAWLLYVLALLLWPVVMLAMTLVARKDARERRKGPWAK